MKQTCILSWWPLQTDNKQTFNRYFNNFLSSFHPMPGQSQLRFRRHQPGNPSNSLHDKPRRIQSQAQSHCHSQARSSRRTVPVWAVRLHEPSRGTDLRPPVQAARSARPNPRQSEPFRVRAVWGRVRAERAATVPHAVPRGWAGLNGQVLPLPRKVLQRAEFGEALQDEAQPCGDLPLSPLPQQVLAQGQPVGARAAAR